MEKIIVVKVDGRPRIIVEKEEYEKFLAWVADNKIRNVAHDLWAMKGVRGDIWYNTSQLVRKFLKESK